MVLNSIHGGRAPRIAVGITALVLLLAGGAGAATPIDACTTISSQGTYVLTQDIVNSTTNTCINITSSNVIFDGAGYTIDGVDAADTAGVFVYNLTNVTVKNLIVTEWDTGIFYTNALNGSIINNTTNSDYYGIYIRSSSNNTLTNNTINSNSNSGIYLLASSNNTLTNNTANSNNGGIDLYLSSNNVLTSNTANSNSGGISIGGSSSNTLTNNTANSNGVGIRIDLAFAIGTPFTSNNNTLISNTANWNSNYGIYLSGSTNNSIYNNFFYNTNNSYISAYFYGNAFPDSPNYWNATKIIGTNIIGGAYLGGNVWANPGGTGFSQTCADNNGDGICDSPYVLDANNTDYFPLAYKAAITPTPAPTPTPTPTPLLVSSITPNSRNAQVGTPVTIFMSVINGGTGTATGVSITQASSLPVNTQFRQWNGTAFIEALNAPVNISAGGTANFVVGINATSAFDTSPLTFNVSSTNGATAPISGVNTLTISASTVPSADIIMMSTSLDVSTAVNTPTVFAVATTNVGGANATGVSFNVIVPSSISGLVVQVNQTNPATGAIIGPATGLTINSGAQPTFVVFVTPTHPISLDLVKNRITLQLVDGSGKVLGAQSVAVSTT
ncbi:MAG: NosD domain-containing protein [Candidatus Methanoperedens sp.]|nr:right-handed parallel beta-helix repeat-containing protein [Candidatus Methanoperedens sp.]MCZ7395933.1 right-handed parallel beta-helix repeat-containing protein [Candidatus Methanoperedens sp.]